MGVRVPVFASSQQLPGSTGIVDASDVGLFQYAESSSAWANMFEDGYPLTYTLDENGKHVFSSSRKTGLGARVRGGQYIEFVFSVSTPGTLVFDGTNYVYSYIKQSNGTFLAEDINIGGPLQIVVDDVVVQTYSDNTTEFSSGSYPIQNRFGIRISSGSSNTSLFYGTTKMFTLFIEIMLNGYIQSGGGSTDPSTPTDPTTPTSPGSGGSTDLSGVIDEIQVVQGTLVNIDGKLEHIQESVTEIETTVKDTHDQLENPDSNIWQAAGSAISDAVTGLFVPEQAELDAKMKEVEEIVIDKLGDTYQVIERVDQYEEELVSGFTGGGRQYNFRFPGISVPLPDGTVTILPEQDVSIENPAFIVFRDLLGTGVALLCGFAAVHIAHDFVICIISGVSYWGFIRGRHNE